MTKFRDQSETPAQVSKIEELIAESVCDESEADLNKVNQIVDLFTYLPKPQSKERPGQASPNIHRVMSSNMKDKATAGLGGLPEQGSLVRNLELIWMRIDERFPNFAAAFRFFDMNFNNRVTFNEFSTGVEALKVKITLKE